MIRPEQIRLSTRRTPTAEHGTPGRMAKVVGHNYFGPDTVVQLELERRRANSRRRSHLRPGGSGGGRGRRAFGRGPGRDLSRGRAGTMKKPGLRTGLRRRRSLSSSSRSPAAAEAARTRSSSTTASIPSSPRHWYPRSRRRAESRSASEATTRSFLLPRSSRKGATHPPTSISPRTRPS